MRQAETDLIQEDLPDQDYMRAHSPRIKNAKLKSIEKVVKLYAEYWVMLDCLINIFFDKLYHKIVSQSIENIFIYCKLELQEQLEKLTYKEKISREKITEICNLYKSLFQQFDSMFDQDLSDKITYNIINNTLLLRKSKDEQIDVDLYHDKDQLELSLKIQKQMQLPIIKHKN